MATVFSGLIFMLEFSNLKFGNFHLKRKKFSPVRTNSDSFKGKCELFCVFLCNFYWAVMKWIHFIVKCYNSALLISNYTWTELSFVISLSKNVLSVVHNGNWIEWSAVWSEIICMTLKLDMRAVQVWFEITSMSSDQNLATWSSITTLLEPFWNHKIQSVPILCWSSSKLDGLLKRGVWNHKRDSTCESNLISDENCSILSSITTSLQPFWNCGIQSVPIFCFQNRNGVI